MTPESRAALILVIRNQQMEVFRRHASASLQDELARLLVKHYPSDCRLAGGEPQIRQLVAAGVAEAKKRGYAGKRDISLWVHLSFMLGVDFDRDPQLPWVAAQLPDLEELHRSARSYLGTTAGENGEHIVRAMLRMRAYDLGTASVAAGQAAEAELCNLLQEFYPQKYAYQGKPATLEMIRQTTAAAARRGIRSAPGMVTCTVLAFMLGTGFDRDPLYPWAGRALKDPEPGGEAARVDRLYKDAIQHLNESLAGH